MGRTITKDRAAETDLIGIWIYSFEQWSAAQADHYLTALEKGIRKLAEDPQIGKPRDGAIVAETIDACRLVLLEPHLECARRALDGGTIGSGLEMPTAQRVWIGVNEDLVKKDDVETLVGLDVDGAIGVRCARPLRAVVDRDLGAVVHGIRKHRAAGDVVTTTGDRYLETSYFKSCNQFFEHCDEWFFRKIGIITNMRRPSLLAF